jgi:hypothetical protein
VTDHERHVAEGRPWPHCDECERSLGPPEPPRRAVQAGPEHDESNPEHVMRCAGCRAKRQDEISQLTYGTGDPWAEDELPAGNDIEVAE